jgi:hypothetical protein
MDGGRTKKKSVSQIIKEKKRQAVLTLQWYVVQPLAWPAVRSLNHKFSLWIDRDNFRVWGSFLRVFNPLPKF